MTSTQRGGRQGCVVIYNVATDTMNSINLKSKYSVKGKDGIANETEFPTANCRSIFKK